MSLRFNPPPGWPAPPPDWTPPPDWAPDPSWPAPPPGWRLWVPAEGAPPEPSGAPRPGGRRRIWWVVGAAAALVVVLGAVTTAVVLIRSSDDQPPPPDVARPTDPSAATDPPPNEICEPQSWDGEITAEGFGSSRVSLDGLPDHLFFYITYSYTPGDGQDYFLVNTVVDGDEGGFIYRFQEGAVTSSALLLNRYGDQSPTELVVDTEGTWTLRIQEFLATPVWPEITEGGAGGVAMRVEPGTLAGPTRVVADHDDYFSVNVYTDGAPPPGLTPISEQLVLSAEGGTSDFVLPANTCLVSIGAMAAWTLTLP